MYKKAIPAALLLLFATNSYAQFNDSTSAFRISGYVDVYYARSTDSVGANNYIKFPVISPRNNEIGLNIAQLTAQYTSAKVRAVATFHYGDIASSAWSSAFNMVQEANVGIKLYKKWWLDAGLFKTHIGTEALLPKDNVANTLAMITFYEPWYQAGAKLSYTPSDKLSLALHVLNGYNTFVETNNRKDVGLSVSYAFSDKGSIGYYNLVGDEMPDSIKTPHTRITNNIVFNYQFTPKLKTAIGLDYIGQQNSGYSDATKFAAAYGAIVTLKYQMKTKFGIYGRYDMFNDEDGFLSGTSNRYKANSITLGLEAKPTENSYIRLEGRDIILDNNQKIFYNDGTITNSRLEVMINIGVWF